MLRHNQAELGLLLRTCAAVGTKPKGQAVRKKRTPHSGLRCDSLAPIATHPQAEHRTHGRQRRRGYSTGEREGAIHNNIRTKRMGGGSMAAVRFGSPRDSCSDLLHQRTHVLTRQVSFDNVRDVVRGIDELQRGVSVKNSSERRDLPTHPCARHSSIGSKSDAKGTEVVASTIVLDNHLSWWCTNDVSRSNAQQSRVQLCRVGDPVRAVGSAPRPTSTPSSKQLTTCNPLPHVRPSFP